MGTDGHPVGSPARQPAPLFYLGSALGARMGRHRRAVQPWSSAEAARKACAEDWGEKVFENLTLDIDRAEVRNVTKPMHANNVRNLEAELRTLKSAAQRVRRLVFEIRDFNPDVSPLVWALRAHGSERTYEHRIAVADNARFDADRILASCERLAVETKRLVERLRPTLGHSKAEVTNASLLAAAAVLRGRKLSPPITGTRAAWVAIALNLELPAKDAEQFQRRRRVWDGRLKERPRKRSPLDLLRGKPPASAVAEEQAAVAKGRARMLDDWARHFERLVREDRMDDALGLFEVFGADLVDRVVERLVRGGARAETIQTFRWIATELRAGRLKEPGSISALLR